MYLLIGIIKRLSGHATSGTITENIKLDKTGKIGIGTSSPAAPLHVVASGSANPTTNSLYVHNEGTSENDDAIITVRTGSSTGGDPFMTFDVAGERGWAWGMDNSDNKTE